MEPKLETQMEFDFMNNQDKNKFGIKQMLGLLTFAAIGLSIGKTMAIYDPNPPQTNLENYVVLSFGALTSIGYLAHKLPIFSIK